MIRSTAYIIISNLNVADTSATPVKSFSDLTIKQKQVYAHFKGIYDSDQVCLELTQLLEPRGENCFKSVTDKIDSIIRGDYKLQLYQDALYDNFVIGRMYSSDAIIAIVGQVRRDNGLQTYLSSIRRNCERDFFQLYIVHPVTREVCCDDSEPGATRMKKITDGYKPMFRLKPED